MVKHSKRNRRRMQQGGFGGGFTIVRRIPIRQPQAPALNVEGRFRLFVEHAARTSVREAAHALAIPVATIYRWHARYRHEI